MKKLLFLLCAVFLFPFSNVAQETEEVEPVKEGKPYDRWSIEFGVGSALPGSNFTQGYGVVDPTEEYQFPPFATHFELGVRYMINEKFGLRLGGNYQTFEAGDNSTDFESYLYRVNVEGVVNMRSLLNFDSWTKRFGLLLHGGVHQSWRHTDSRDGVDVSGGEADHDGGFILGFTPQYRLSNTFVLYADASFVSNYRTHTAIDGGRLDGVQSTRMGSVSLGLQVYLGKHDVHADYYVEPVMDYEDEIAGLQNELDEIEERVTTLEERPYVDNNNNGVSDIVEDYLVANYVNKGDKTDVTYNEIYNTLLDGEHINIFFGYDKTKPEVASVNDLNALIDFMKENTDKNIVLTGYTDVYGSEAYNDNLSLNRAKFINDLLVASGVDQSRIEFNGDGVNPNYGSKDEYVRMLARRVSVKVAE